MVSKKNYVLLAACVASFLSAFATSSVVVALPSIAKQFSMDVVTQNWVMVSFLLTIAIASIPIGKIANIYGLKKSFIAGIVVFIIASIISAMANSTSLLMGARIIQGIAGATLSVTSLAMVSEALPPNERGKGIGMNISSVYIGLAIAPVIGGILNYNFGWSSVFLFAVPFAFIPLAIVIFKIKDEWVHNSKGKFDYIGSFIFGLAMLALVYGFTILNQLFGQILTVLGIILFIIFTFWELRVSDPVFNVSLFKNFTFASSTIAALISYLATFAVTYMLNYHFQYILDLNSQLTGMILIITPIMMAILAPVSGKLSDKIKPQKLSALGMGFVSIALFMLIFLDKSTTIEYIALAMFLQGIGYGLFSSPNTNAIMSSVERKFASSASAIVSTMRVVGQTLSIGLLTMILALIMGAVPIIPEYYPLLTQSCQIMAMISTVLCVIAIFASLVGVRGSR
ncbi:MAG: MFS transporter [Methanobacteriaceae archaeon]